MKEINRSSVNQGQYAAPEFQKSGFDLSHKRYGSYMLGRIHVSGYQEVMPGDKISGKNDGNFTFNRIVTPMVAPVDVAQYNMYIPYRALDRTFERAFAPSKNNSMSIGWTAPSFRLDELVLDLFTQLFAASDGTWDSTVKANVLKVLNSYKTSDLGDIGVDGSANDTLYGTKGVVTSLLDRLDSSSSVFVTYAKNMYLEDFIEDYKAFIISRVGDTNNRVSPGMAAGDFCELFLDAILTPFVGRYSYLCELGYNYIRPKDIYMLSHSLLPGDEDLPLDDITEFTNMLDATPQNEYALRAMYVIWYEHFRNVDLEPVSNDLPYWRDFGNTTIFTGSQSNLFYLVYRIRAWYKDMFTTAQIDDLSRHVFAPVYSSSEGNVVGHTSNYNNLATNNDADVTDAFSGGQKPALYTLSWRDQLSGTQKTIECPVPANVNDVLSALDMSSSDVYGLDLNSLRQAQMLEKYLKRNYLFGDEYQDRMLAHYNSRVSDLRINRPEILSQSLNGSNMEQEVSNVSTAETKVGDRTATGTLQASGDQFTTYCEEFGIIIHIITFMPQACYDGICPQRLLSKVVDYPLPEFAANNEEFGRRREIADSGIGDRDSQDPEEKPGNFMFGRYPAYHAWRSRVDEVSGMFLNELQDCTFRRFWGLNRDDTTPKLNYEFIHCHPNLQMFANTVMYDSQIYGDVIHECFVERVLPTPVEVI